MENFKEFTTTWTQRKRTKKCVCCHKLMKAGDQARMRQVVIEKYYPVKGIMRFGRWYVCHEAHESCPHRK